MKAIALFSGGLDSTLAMKLIIDQGIDVIALNVNTGFGATKSKRDHMQSMCDQVGAELMIVDVQNEYVQDLLFSPKYGYGKNFNPCIDCHGFMFSVAKRMMKELDASFLISGEVIGQRPMSQNKEALETVLDLGDVEGLLVRPMCAKRMKPTIPEEKGWIDREKLLGIYGRSRNTQMELAEKYGLKDFESPGGGCLLTDENFSIKIREFIKHDDFDVADIPVLKYGRHFRLPDNAKLVIGRHQEDNEGLQAIENSKFIGIHTLGTPGPFSLLSANATQEERELAAKMIATYSKKTEDGNYTIAFGEEYIHTTAFETKQEVQPYAIL
jgi:tRNA-specific 2-thiouridylase